MYIYIYKDMHVHLYIYIYMFIHIHFILKQLGHTLHIYIYIHTCDLYIFIYICIIMHISSYIYREISCVLSHDRFLAGHPGGLQVTWYFLLSRSVEGCWEGNQYVLGWCVLNFGVIVCGNSVWCLGFVIFFDIGV